MVAPFKMSGVVMEVISELISSGLIVCGRYLSPYILQWLHGIKLQIAHVHGNFQLYLPRLIELIN